MKHISLKSVAILILIGSPVAFAQIPAETPAPPVTANKIVPENIEQVIGKTDVSREQREQAYVKLLEGQRYVWNLMYRSRSQATVNGGVRLAIQSLRKAIELDPRLAEAYTALAELIMLTAPEDLEDAVTLAGIAVKIDTENFGGHRILARLYTVKSRLNNGVLEPNAAQKAISEWKEIGRLDPRNAEAFAFLSEFYRQSKKPAENIDALRKWLSATAPLPREARFYQTFFRGQSDLSPESAILKYGQALLETGETREAIEVLSRAVADNPENETAIEFLRQAVESADAASAANAVQSLQQAIFANPENTTLIEVLAQMQARSGKINDAAQLLSDATAKLAGKNKNSAADLQVVLGDIYAKANRVDESIAAYQNALTARGISAEEASVKDSERDFAIHAFDKMIEVYKKANRPNDAKSVIERARTVLGKADLFADKRLISLYQETGKRAEALRTIRALRGKTPADIELVRLEARILTEDNRVEEAVALIKSAPNQGNGVGIGDETQSIPDSISPEVGKYLYISELYTLAKRPKEAVQAVSQALSSAKNKYEKEVVNLTLATMQQTTGDFNAAENTLRAMLKESPRNSIALNNLGYFLAERGEKLDEALKFIQQALELDPNNSSFLDSLGWTYFKLGKLSDAENNLKAAVKIDDTSATVQEHLGDVYQKQGKTELAAQTWQKALTLAADINDINRLKTKLKIK